MPENPVLLSLMLPPPSPPLPTPLHHSLLPLPPYFPYRLSCVEPTDDWTVEHVFQWSLLQSYKATDDQYQQISQALHQQLAAGEEEVWQVHQEVLRQADAEEDGAGDGRDIEQQPSSQLESEQPSAPGPEPHSSPMHKVPLGEVSENKPPANNEKHNSKSSPAAQKPSKTGPPANTIRVEIVGGMYEGKVFDLQPKPRTPCMVGRSGGKKFKDKGISLTKDLEVSTTHGKFEIINGNFYFTDTGSTNGTKVEGEELEPDTPFPLTNNLEILCGQTLLKITLP
jgi:hypothetical protein